MSDDSMYANDMEHAIVKYFACNKKLNTFTEYELRCLPKAFLVFVAAKAVKEIWQDVPREWTRDPILSELQPCDQFEHHHQVAVSRVPSVRECRTCQLYKLYHRPKETPCLTYHDCEAVEEEAATTNPPPREKQDKADSNSSPTCWTWTH